MYYLIYWKRIWQVKMVFATSKSDAVKKLEVADARIGAVMHHTEYEPIEQAVLKAIVERG